MAKYAFNLLYIVLTLIFVVYLALPLASFPPALPDSIQSTQPADQEDTNRRGYYTNLTREEVIAFYESNFGNQAFFGISLPKVRVNYPPEEAQQKIRDQTSSTFLEEIIHPMRESLFINGFKPREDKDGPLEVEGITWHQKIIVKYIPSNTFPRVIIGLLAFCLLYVLIVNWKMAVAKFISLVWRKK